MTRDHTTTGRRGIGRVAGAAATLALLAGCAAEVPQPDPGPSETDPAPVLDDDRMERILRDVQDVIEEGDQARDPEILESRLSGPALEMRSAEYRLADASDGAQLPTPLTTDSQIEVVSATDEWPRSVFVVSSIPDESNLPLLLVLTQEDPRSQYKLWLWTSLLPGAETPTVASPETGSPPLGPDAEGFVLTPREALEAYAEHLAEPSDDGDIAEDRFATGYREMIDALAATVEVAGEVDEQYSIQDGSVAAMATDDDGALVVGVIEAQLTIDKTVDGSTLDAGGDIALLMGDSSRIEGSVTADYLIPVAIEVPAGESGDPLLALGAEHIIAGITVDEPEDEDEGDGEEG